MQVHDPSRLERARASLEGLALGDAFGEQFFGVELHSLVHPETMLALIVARHLPEPPWAFTDDTQMALSVVAVLAHFGRVDQAWLAASFAGHFEPDRGYGQAMYELLPRLRAGAPWRAAAADLFGGQGSFGNGAAMRVAPLGAYFADDVGRAAEQAARSAEVTHVHPEGIAGAVAVAAAWASRLRGTQPLPTRQEFLELVLPAVPAGAVREGLRRALELSPETSVDQAAWVLGSGWEVTAQDTVPFVLWCAGTHLADYTEALWTTVSGLGDRDTTCAIVGGIVAAHVGLKGLPAEWLRRREPLPDWPFQDPPGA
jgi:ADP-ribosylglycohydrolase